MREELLLPRRPLIPRWDGRDVPRYEMRMAEYKKLLLEWRKLWRFKCKVSGCAADSEGGYISADEYNRLADEYNARRNRYVIDNDGFLETRDAVIGRIRRISNKADQMNPRNPKVMEWRFLYLDAKAAELTKYDRLITMEALDFRKVTIEEIREIVELEVEDEEEARQIEMYLARKKTTLSIPELAQIFDVSHARIFKAVHDIERRRETDEKLKALLDRIDKEVW